MLHSQPSFGVMETVRYQSRTQIRTQFILDILACAAKSSPNNVAESLSAKAKGIFCVGGVQIGLNMEKDVVKNLSRLLFAMELL